MTGDLPIALSCTACGKQFHLPLSELKADFARCPACNTAVPVTEEQIDAAVERKMLSERKSMKPKFGGL